MNEDKYKTKKPSTQHILAGKKTLPERADKLFVLRFKLHTLVEGIGSFIVSLPWTPQ
jgi:hypothetical protein